MGCLGGDQRDDESTDGGKRRGRIALLAGATATIAVGTAAVLAIASAGAGGAAADPRVTTSSTTPAATGPGAAPPLSDWESHSFQGMTFAVPPGGQMAEDSEQRHGPTFRWSGRDLGHGGVEAYESVTIVVSRPDGELPPPDGDGTVSVRGAVAVRNGVGPADITSRDPDDTIRVTAGGVQMFTADAVVFLGVQFAAGPVGEQMARDLLASIDLSGLDPPA
jgi:hypothetical protein